MKSFNPADIAGTLGFLAATIGLIGYDWRLACVVGGAVLLAGGVVGALRAR